LFKNGSKLKLLRSTTSADVTVVNTYNSQHMQDDKQFA